MNADKTNTNSLFSIGVDLRSSVVPGRAGIRRRDFIGLAASACIAPVAAAGRVPVPGRVVFCRVSAESLPEAIAWIREVLGGPVPHSVSGTTLRYRDFVAAYEGRGRELVICGADSTLVIDRAGARRFA